MTATRLNPELAPTSTTLATDAVLYRWGRVRMLVLNGYKTKYSYTAGEYSTSKVEFSIPEGSRAPTQVYGMLGTYGGRLLHLPNGNITLQPHAAMSANSTVYASMVWLSDR